MQAEVGVRMSFCVVRNFREPGPRNDDARRRDVTFIERFQTRCVFGVGNREVIRMNDQEFCIGGVAETFGDGFGLCEIRQTNTE